MVDKLEEITQKIYAEGVIKAKNDADQIITDAKNKADKIIQSAKETQNKIIEEAKNNAAEIKQKNEVELQLAAQQFISQLKQQITSLIATTQVDTNIKKAFDDCEFVQQIILKIINNWKPDDTENTNIKLLLPESSKEEFVDFFDSNIFKTLNKTVSIEFDKKIGNGFKIGPSNGSYIISFTDTDFENYFKSYLKDRTKELLFDSTDQE